MRSASLATGNRSSEDLLSRQPLSELREAPVLIKRTERQTAPRLACGRLRRTIQCRLDRRTFLRRSGLAAGGLAALGALPLASVRKAEAGPPAAPGAAVTIRKNICTHCAVGCTVTAEVRTAYGSARSRDGTARSIAARIAPRAPRARTRARRSPAQISDEARQRPVDPDQLGQAINEIGDKLMEIRQKSGPGFGLLARLGEILQRRRLSLPQVRGVLGHQQSDHQARICHSTTVTGVANTWGYGAMTNSFNDIRNAKTMIIMGGNPAEAHPVSLQHVLEGKELNRANFIVIDPRMTRTAAHANEYVRIRPGTDIPVSMGMLWHIFGTAGRTRNSSSSASMVSRRRARKSRSGRPKRSSASAAFPARNSSASPKCSRRKSRRL